MNIPNNLHPGHSAIAPVAPAHEAGRGYEVTSHAMSCYKQEDAHSKGVREKGTLQCTHTCPAYPQKRTQTIGLGVMPPVPSRVLQQGQRQRAQHVRSRRYDAAQSLGVQHTLVPVIAGAGFLPRRLDSPTAPPPEIMAVELIPRHRRRLGRYDGRVSLSGRSDEEFPQCPRPLARAYARRRRRTPPAAT
jgi:hypothetical protein